MAETDWLFGEPLGEVGIEGAVGVLLDPWELLDFLSENLVVLKSVSNVELEDPGAPGEIGDSEHVANEEPALASA